MVSEAQANVGTARRVTMLLVDFAVGGSLGIAPPVEDRGGSPMVVNGGCDLECGVRSTP